MKKEKNNVLVVGGSRGIGSAIVKKYMDTGNAVVFFYNKSREEAELLEKCTGALSIHCDVTEPKAVAEAIIFSLKQLKIDGFDIVIYNAGVSKVELFDKMSDNAWHEVMDINLNGAFYILKETTPHMIREKYGKIVAISSMWGQVGASMEVAYAASKAGLIGMIKSLAKELGPSGINVNCVAPGLIDTDMNKSLSAEEVAEIIEETPIQKIGETNHIADAVYYLTSESAEYITGQVIGINGGLVI